MKNNRDRAKKWNTEILGSPGRKLDYGRSLKYKSKEYPGLPKPNQGLHSKQSNEKLYFN